MEPEKPFACSMPDCGMTFTNEDHLHVHTKKHDMVLQLGIEQKAAFVADQTPTPTRFIRNCEEVGLFQDLQNVNPFDEGFKRAMETKHCILSLEPPSNEDALHTPHLVFPLDSGDCTLYTTNNQRNITISRSSSDESGVVKEYETTKISKLTNEVTTISRVVGKDVLDRVTTTDDVSIVRHEETTTNKDTVNETSVSYRNNVVKIHSNVEIRKDNVNIDAKKNADAVGNADSVVKDTVNIDILLTDNKKDKLPPIMSQRSLDFVVDSLATDNENSGRTLKRNLENSDKNQENKDKNTTKLDDYEVIIKLPNGKQVRMKAAEEIEKPAISVAKEKLNMSIRNKIQKPVKRNPSTPGLVIQNVMPIAATLIPVTLVPATKIPIAPLHSTIKTNYKTVKRKPPDGNVVENGADIKCNVKLNTNKEVEDWCNKRDNAEVKKDWSIRHAEAKNNSKSHLDSRSAASKRYRDKLKLTMQKQSEENKHLREVNRRLAADRAALQAVLAQHLAKCPLADELHRTVQDKLLNVGKTIHRADKAS